MGSPSIFGRQGISGGCEMASSLGAEEDHGRMAAHAVVGHGVGRKRDG